MVYFETDCEEYYYQSLGNAICEKVSLKEAWKKVILFLADIIDWIVKWCGKIIKWIKGLFTKKQPRSAEQILVSLGVASQDDVDAKNIVVPKADDSEVTPMQPKDLDFALKPLMVSFKNDQSITISFQEVKASLMGSDKDMKIKGQDSGLSGIPKFFHALYKLELGRPIIALYYIKNIGQSQDQLLAYCKILYEEKTKNSSLVDLVNFTDKVWENARTFADQNKNGCDVKVSELERFGQTLSKCSELLRKYDESQTPMDKYWYTAASRVSSMIAELQYGLNDITRSLKGVYVMSPAHCNTIRDIGMLSKFAAKMIEAGIPSKYIGFNIYMASHGDLKGQGSALNPVWGQSRVTLFPIKNDKVVYKIALNGTGVRSNRIESSSWATIQSSNYSEWFAAVNAVTKNRCVVEMERVNTDKKGHVHKASIVEEVREKVKSICQELNLPNDLSIDIHVGNIGWKNNHACVIDYGNGVSNLFAKKEAN